MKFFKTKEKIRRLEEEVKFFQTCVDKSRNEVWALKRDMWKLCEHLGVEFEDLPAKRVLLKKREL